MKKRTVLALACILALSMAACGNKQGGQGGGSKTEGEAKRVPKVEPYTAVDKEDYAIQVDGIEVDEDGYYSIQLTFENKSKDKEFNFSLDSLSGDGIRLDSFIGCDVAAGKKSKETIDLPYSEYYDMRDFGELELGFSVGERGYSAAHPKEQESFRIYPYGENSGVKFERKVGKDEKVLTENENFRVTQLGGAFDDRGRYVLTLFIENKGDKDLRYEAEKISINDYMVDTSMTGDLKPGESGFAELRWSKRRLEESQITEVKEIEFTLRVIDREHPIDAPLFREVLTVTP